jgi:predicted signal transduction protein with EAL and GGDEF domain
MVMVIAILILASLSFVPYRAVSVIALMLFIIASSIYILASSWTGLLSISYLTIFVLLGLVTLGFVYNVNDFKTYERNKSTPLQAIAVGSVVTLSGALLVLIESRKSILLTLEEQYSTRGSVGNILIDQYAEISLAVLFLILGIISTIGIYAKESDG